MKGFLDKITGGGVDWGSDWSPVWRSSARATRCAPRSPSRPATTSTPEPWSRSLDRPGDHGRPAGSCPRTDRRRCGATSGRHRGWGPLRHLGGARAIAPGAPFRGCRPLGTDRGRCSCRAQGPGVCIQWQRPAALALSCIAGSGESGTSETLTVWQGTVGPASAAQGWHRYAFEGVLPANLVPTVQLLTGGVRVRPSRSSSRAACACIRHGREVALATSP